MTRAFCVSAGYHRYFSHRAFKTSRLLQFVLAFVGGMAVMRGALWWAAHHRNHHAFSDQEQDSHSPREGLLWAHCGWFTVRGNQRTREELIKDFHRFPELHPRRRLPPHRLLRRFPSRLANLASRSSPRLHRRRVVVARRGRRPAYRRSTPG